MALHPLVIDLEAWPVTVVGGGDLAAAHVHGLLQAGARVTVVAPELSPALAALASEGRLIWQSRPWADGDLAGARLVFAATGQASVNAAVAEEARRLGLPCCLGDHPEASTLAHPAYFKRGPMTVAVSAGAAAAELDERMRRKLELAVPALYGRLAEIVHRYADKAREQISDRKQRLAFQKDLVAFLDGPEVHEDLARGHLDGALAGARDLLRKHVERARRP